MAAISVHNICPSQLMGEQKIQTQSGHCSHMQEYMVRLEDHLYQQDWVYFAAVISFGVDLPD